jgi:truncated hemoglobin YjbI
MDSSSPSGLEDLERRVRDRGVRVEERLEILRVLSEAGAEAQLAARQEELLATVRRASDKLKGTAG